MASCGKSYCWNILNRVKPYPPRLVEFDAYVLKFVYKPLSIFSFEHSRLGFRLSATFGRQFEKWILMRCFERRRSWRMSHSVFIYIHKRRTLVTAGGPSNTRIAFKTFKRKLVPYSFHIEIFISICLRSIGQRFRKNWKRRAPVWDIRVIGPDHRQRDLRMFTQRKNECHFVGDQEFVPLPLPAE